ncbi:P-loop containing nucleoside triphosphate hydrolase protein [Massariosphaeria phaeospora]|uniref:Cell division control protein n=1 Tax=Massariosphaeria phaeospora TaxID=100035 RepID=A0A7C8IDC6_9PLEO|nr:P-loop containing nucleoside triphosphate hydrolase protein [Massariosphaeria phaeospora]
MSTSVLGKRTRSAANAEAADAVLAASTRAKPRTQFVILDEAENENPFITPRKPARNGDAMHVDRQEEKPVGKRGRGVNTTPAKHGAPESRVPLSTAEVNSPSKAPAEPVEKPVSTPQTPRRRDALANKIAVTPRHRLLAAGRPPTPRTPHTPSTPRNSAPTIYNEARQLFARGSAPPALFGREQERSELETFISTRTKSKKSGCIYVSGPPGTGKSALVNEVCRTIECEEAVYTGYVNCMSVKNSVDLYRTLLEQFVDVTEIQEGDEMESVKKLFMQRKSSYVVTLDEVDHLLELDIDLLYNIFHWSLQRSSGLVLVGIANALDFTDRFLPRLKARGLKPQLLPFLPYTAPQISSIITSKLKSLLPVNANNVPFIHPTAIMFLAKKIAQSGDLRKAFDICRRAIDLIEADTRDQHIKNVSEITPSPTPSPSKTPLVENINLSSPAIRSPSKGKAQGTLAASLAELTVESAPRATIAHMARITAAVFSNGTVQRLQNLNLQQKAVLCALSALEKKKRALNAENVFATPSKTHGTAPTIKALFEAYTSLCKRENILHALTSTEFRDIVGSLESLSLVSAVEGKAGSLVATGTPTRKGRGGGFGETVVEDRRVASAVGMKELGTSLVGPGCGILKGILEGDEGF